jgi:hypothetical protein
MKGRLNSINSCIREIRLLNEEIDPECTICNNHITIPFTLFNCRHRFCWSCLAFYLREMKQKPSEDVKCVEEKCRLKINLFDIKLILAEEEFMELCDIKIKEYIRTHKDYTACSNCNQIFETASLKKQKKLNCHLCGSVEDLKPTK